MVGIEAPSIRPKALRLPASSRMVTFSLTPSSLAFAIAAFTIFCANSEEMPCFVITLVIGSSQFCVYCALNPARRLDRKPIPEHRPTAPGFGLGGFVLNHVPVLHKDSVDDTNEVRNDPVPGLSEAREATVHDHELAVCHYLLVLVLELWRHR